MPIHKYIGWSGKSKEYAKKDAAFVFTKTAYFMVFLMLQ